jgi:hypothetical protein
VGYGFIGKSIVVKVNKYIKDRLATKTQYISDINDTRPQREAISLV